MFECALQMRSSSGASGLETVHIPYEEVTTISPTINLEKQETHKKTNKRCLNKYLARGVRFKGLSEMQGFV